MADKERSRSCCCWAAPLHASDAHPCSLASGGLLLRGTEGEKDVVFTWTLVVHARLLCLSCVVVCVCVFDLSC